MFRVPASGGVPAPLTTLDQSRQEDSHRWPDFLPDGRRFIYFARSTQTEKSGIYAGSLDSKDRKLILGTDRAAKYADPGYLLFVREKTLMAQQFDAKSLQLSGEPFPVAEDVDSSSNNQSVAVSLSQTGVLAYGGVVASNRHFVWFDHNGKSLSVVEPPGVYRDMALSPDEKRVAMQRYDVGGGPSDIWLLDLVRSTPSRFTFDPATDDTPFWSPDGTQIVFSSERAGHSDIYRKVASGAGNDELLLQSDVAKYPTDWSHDGRFILFENYDPKTKSDIWILPLFGDGKPFPFLQTGFIEWQARFSPDGHWIAYVSDESGKTEVYVQSFPSSGGRWPISNGGGGQPRWSYDGKQLFYIAPDRKLMAVEVKAGITFEASVPVPLFDSHVDSYTGTNRYAVSRDGRFLINQAIEETVSTPMTVVVNWIVKK